MTGVEAVVDEMTIGVTSTAQIPKQRGAAHDTARGTSLLETAVSYAEERHWDVFPGTWLEAAEGVQRCSCGDPACEAPGAHAAREDWPTQATGSATGARRLWSKQPTASILLPTGRSFDVLDVPETAGFLALARMERMGLTLGPVTRTPDRRMHFLVQPGGAAKVTDLVRKLGWSPLALDLVALGEGSYVAAPPTRVGGRGAVQWACRPTVSNRWLPDAEEIISPVAYACGRDGRR
ncbi:bifunctional DNA primase/polymerase [Streptomyces sp. NPDC002896]|uniref:bifunctional DNA primase/polymerase n=1 Tax=Streptomyces sp. NPDC002896 TaxID=3154438 RepID=UPI0033224ADE